MFIGEYKHTMDDKKRVSLPAKFRRELGKKVVVTRGLDQCLFVYSHSEWRTFAGQLSKLSVGQSDSRAFSRFILSGATEIDVDSAGRILIADFLRNFAKLKESIVINGVGGRVEIWDELLWKKYNNSVEQNADAVAEKLGDIGMI